MQEPTDNTAEPSNRLRPLAFWLQHYAPGWPTRETAAQVDPIAVATEIATKLIAFERWLLLSAEQRWDTFALQSLSAALFRRYPNPAGNAPGDVALQQGICAQLTWPAGSEEIRALLGALQERLAAPLAVFKAVRCAVDADDFPRRAELDFAEAALVADREVLAQLRVTLDEAICRFRLATACVPAASPQPRRRSKQRSTRVVAASA